MGKKPELQEVRTLDGWVHFRAHEWGWRADHDPWVQEILEAKQIHDERRKIYGDKWIVDKEYATMQLWGKAQRARHLLKVENDYERLEDTLLDIINYAVFALMAIRKEPGKHRKIKFEEKGDD